MRQLFIALNCPLIYFSTTNLSTLVPLIFFPFTFLRVLSLVPMMRQLFIALDCPEIVEQLILTVMEFFAMVFSFAGKPLGC
jgi:hypothetical protein